MFRHNLRHRLHSAAETLEPRMLLDATGFLWGDAPQLTLSFAPDGTNVAGLPSALHGAFDALGNEADWQGTILRAFQTWASLTNGDIGVVPDSGLPFGVPGFSRDDARFGDVRIAAAPLAEDVLAVSIPSDTLVAGVWSGDVLFNSNASWASLTDLFSVALHEAGHVFGLEHSTDPASPMHVHGVSSATEPTADDIAFLRALHGARMPDLNEYVSSGNDGGAPGVLVGNETLATATRIQKAQDGAGADGSAPSIVHGDITSASDVDYFWWDGLSDYDGPVTITVRSSGMSLLAPQATLLDENGDPIASATSTSQAGDAVTIQLAANDRHAKYFLKVAGAEGPLGVGHYSVTVSFDDVVTADPARIALFAGREFRFATPGQIRDLFEQGSNSLFNDDDHADDDPLEPGELNTAIGFVEGTRYEAIGSISDTLDVDHYLFKSPQSSGQHLPMTIVVTALETGGLIPRVELFTGDQEVVVAPIVANGNGQLVVQLPAALPDDEYVLRVSAEDAAGAHATGNYRLSIIFGGQPVELVDFAAGELTSDAPQAQHALHVGQTQLMHLLVEARDPSGASGIWMTVRDARGAIRARVGVHSGDTRSAGAMLLEPGTYSVELSVVSLDGSPIGLAAYVIRGAVISDPLGPVLHDPTNDPVFSCPGQTDVYCYPGGVQSPDPFLWTDFQQGEPGGVAPSDPNALFNDWWNWYWSLQPGDTNGDQNVDLTDLNNVRNNFGATGSAPLGDTDGDGAVNLDDLNRVRNNFGAGDVAPSPLRNVSRLMAAAPSTAVSPAPGLSKAVDAVFATYAGGPSAASQRRRSRLV